MIYVIVKYYCRPINVVCNLIYDIITIERNADVLLNACKDIGLAVNIRKNKYMGLGHYWGVMANEHITQVVIRM